MEKKTKILIIIALIVPLSFLLQSCNPVAEETESTTLLLIDSLLGTDLEGKQVNYLLSDVLNVDEASGSATIAADNASVKLRAALLDPSPSAAVSQFNNLQITRYFVSYMRSDGRNTEGIDVPYSFEGQLSSRIEVGASIDVNFVIVRAVAKGEPPLLSLRDGRSEGVITITAKVEFYGHDLRDKNVKATGYLTIYFANYAGN